MHANGNKNAAFLGFETTLRRVKFYAQYQERSQFEIENYLKKLGVFSEAAQAPYFEILLGENYISEERFVQHFVSGKHSLKGWGKNKIIQHLKQHKISESLIKKGLKYIDEVADYEDDAQRILEKKWALLSKTKDPLKKQKLIRYMLQKGYEYNVITALMQKLSI